MARLRDVGTLLKSVGLLEFGKRVWHQVNDDNLFAWAAALAYSWLFALFPFLLFLLALIPYLPRERRDQAQHSVHHFLNQWLPHEASKTIRENIEGNVSNLLHQPRGWLLYTGLIIALWAASGGMAATMSALDKCYELDRGRAWYRQRVLAIFMTIAVMVLLLLVGFLLPVASAVRDWFVVYQPWIAKYRPALIVFDIARWFLATIFLLGVLAMIYYKGPSVRHRFHWLTPGAVFCLGVWLLLGFALRFYMDKMGERGYDRTYGALGGVAMMLLLFYVDALVLLIGAEINSEIDFEVLKVRRGSRDFLSPEDSQGHPVDAQAAEKAVKT